MKKKLDHEREKIIKRDNIVLYNVPVNLELTHWSHQQKEDIDFVKEMFSFLLDDEFENQEITKLVRHGKRNFLTGERPETSRSRPILVELCSGMTKI